MFDQPKEEKNKEHFSEKYPLSSKPSAFVGEMAAVGYAVCHSLDSNKKLDRDIDTALEYFRAKEAKGVLSDAEKTTHDYIKSGGWEKVDGFLDIFPGEIEREQKFYVTLETALEDASKYFSDLGKQSHYKHSLSNKPGAMLLQAVGVGFIGYIAAKLMGLDGLQSSKSHSPATNDKSPQR